MSDENKEQQNQQKQEEQDARKKALKTGAKAAASAYAGPIGGKAVDLVSKTKLGDAALNAGANSLNKNPAFGKIANAANKSGALDAADKAVDSSSGVDSKTFSNTTTGELNSSSSTKSPLNSNNNYESEEKAEGDILVNQNYSNKILAFIWKKKFIFISVFGGFLLLIFLIIAVIVIVGSPVAVISDFFSGIFNTIIGFFSDDQEKQMNEYYETLKETQVEINKKYGLCIDVNLITAALTVNTEADDFLNEGQGNVIDGDDNPNYDPDSENPDNKETIDVSYKKMKKQVRLLANMQIMTKKYELDSNGSYCANSAESYVITDGSKNSSTKELIAGHDVNGIQAFFTKKSSEEKNYAYYIYHPPFNIDGTCTHSYAKSLLPSLERELSTGDLSTKEDSVFYWNLVNSFIPDYYDEYLPGKDDPTYLEKIKKIAEDIYLLYKDIGPSQTCAVSYAGPSSLCPNGITIEGTGTIDLEEYIAGVVSNEAYSSEGMEALKAQAVAARTYALNYTNYCSNVIPNSTAAQTFTKNINDRAREAVNTTRGEVLVNLDGKVFSAMYDSFCYDDNDCPDSKKNSDGTYTVTYTKMPYGEKHIITLSDPKQQSRINPKHGHAHGMSQLVSYELAKSGMNYREILSYFYSDGVEISLVLSPTTTDGSEIIKGPITNYIASIDSFNQMIYDQVVKSGVGTRSGVVAAATTLVSGFYSQTGYKLPYELIPSGKYEGYGIDPKWGTNTGNANYPLNGLDCSGFISWAIHNGGFAYQIKSANDWGNSGNKRNWSKGTTDDTAKPGDLIFNKPASANGTTGHIRMIIGVNNDGYVVAEASSGKNGVRIMNISFTSTGPYYLVDMSNYYATATKVNDYPG